MIEAGIPEAMFEYFNADSITGDRSKEYGGKHVRFGLSMHDEWRFPILIPKGSFGDYGVRPICVLKSEILESYLMEKGEEDEKIDKNRA